MELRPSGTMSIVQGQLPWMLNQPWNDDLSKCGFFVVCHKTYVAPCRPKCLKIRLCFCDFYSILCTWISKMKIAPGELTEL